MRRSLHPSFGQASGVRSALHPSGVPGASGGAPVWTLDPAISGEPWPGGTVDGTPGTPPSAATYEYKIDGVGTGDTSYLTFVPALGEYSGSLTLVGDASGVIATSNALDLEQVEGLIRASVSSKYLTRAISAIGSAGALVMHVRPTEVSAVNSLGVLLAVGRNAVQPSKYGVEALIDATVSPPQLLVYVFFGVSAGTITATGIDLPAVDGTTDYYVIVEWTGGTGFTAYVAEPGGSWTTYSWTAGGSPAHGTSIVATAWHRASVAPSTSSTSAGSQEAVVLDRMTTSDERAAILAAANLAESGIFGATGRLATLRPDAASAVDGAAAAGAEVDGTWTVAGTGADVVFGGFNAAI